MSLYLAPVLAADAHPEPDVEELGNGQLRIGAIEIDQPARRFIVPGRVIKHDSAEAPIEFLAVTTGGMKSYEAVLELDTDAIAFNLACILIGLDAENAVLPEYHFDPKEVTGDQVAVRASYELDGVRRDVPIEQLLANPGADAARWTYTGSLFFAGGMYAAQQSGTLIGVVHDQESIIQHRRGMGLGDYGAVVVNPQMLPSPDTRVIVSVQVPVGVDAP